MLKSENISSKMLFFEEKCLSLQKLSYQKGKNLLQNENKLLLNLYV